MASDTDSLSTLADSLIGTFPACDDAPLARALLRELAKGQPVATAQLRSTAAETEVTAPGSVPSE